LARDSLGSGGGEVFVAAKGCCRLAPAVYLVAFPFDAILLWTASLNKMVDASIEAEVEDHTAMHYAFLVLAVLLLIYVYSSAYIHAWKINFIHQTGIALLLGVFAGWIFWLNGVTVHFDDKIFFYGILPPIIFAAGYNMKRRRFFRNLGYIGLYGIVGTIISFLIIGIGTF
jgi:hypothetical protein